MQVGELKSTLTEIDKPAQLRLTLTTGIIITIITYGYTPTGHRKAKRTSSSVSPWMRGAKETEPRREDTAYTRPQSH